MKILFLGGDLRYIPIIENLSRKNIIDLIGYSKINTKGIKRELNEINFSNYNIMFLPMSGIDNNLEVTSLDGKVKLNKSDLEQIKSNTIIFTGLITNEVKNINSKEIISFLENKEIKENNNNITVDGIMDKICERQKNKICVLGYGNIGKKVCERLLNLSVDIVIGVKEQSDLDTIKNSFSTANKSDFINNVSKCDILINTVPKNIITKEILESINSNTYIVDIASYPHGINQELIKKTKINYDLYLGIPGKYNPEQSGKILLKKVKNMIGG